LAKFFQCASDPSLAKGERELAWSEGRHAGASKRLFEGLPGWQKPIMLPDHSNNTKGITNYA